MQYLYLAIAIACGLLLADVVRFSVVRMWELRARRRLEKAQLAANYGAFNPYER